MNDLEFLVALQDLINSSDYFKINHRPDGTLHFDDDVIDVWDCIYDIKDIIENVIPREVDVTLFGNACGTATIRAPKNKTLLEIFYQAGIVWMAKFYKCSLESRFILINGKPVRPKDYLKKLEDFDPNDNGQYLICFMTVAENA